MNWYKLAQSKLTTTLIMETNSWISPHGNIYSCSNIPHLEWMKKNQEFLLNECGYDFSQYFYGKSKDIEYEDTPEFNAILACILSSGWIRFIYDGFTYAFEMYSLNNLSTLKIIGDILYDVLSPYLDNEVYLSTVDGSNIFFNWKDFIQSGESFLEFIRGNR